MDRVPIGQTAGVQIAGAMVMKMENYVNLKAEVNGRAGIRNLLVSKAKPVKTGAPSRSCQNIKVWKDPEKNKTNQLHIVIIITQIHSLHLFYKSGI